MLIRERNLGQHLVPPSPGGVLNKNRVDVFSENPTNSQNEILSTAEKPK
jgi:hypothetical protein